MPPTCSLQALCNPAAIYFPQHFSIKKPSLFSHGGGGKLRHSKASCLAQGQGGGQQYPLIWAGLIRTGHFLICTMSIRRLSLPLVNKLFRNYADTLCHPILITRSAFLVGLHEAVQAASQTPESQASSKYTHRLFLITAGRHQLSSNLTSISYHQHGISISVSASRWSSQEGNSELQARVPPPVLEDAPGKSRVGRHTGHPPRSKREGLLRWLALGSTRHQCRKAAGRRGCLC